MSIRIFSRLNKVTRIKGSFFSTSTIPQEEKIKIGKYDINYIKVGSGPHNVLCLPGSFGTIWTDFKPQVEDFDRNKFTLIVWDPPGFGKSRPPEKDYTYNKYHERDADYAYEFMKALELETYSLLGWSVGGITGIIHAAKYPSKMRKLVIWGSYSFTLPYELACHERMKNFSNWSKESLQMMTAIYGEENFKKLLLTLCDMMIERYNKKGANLCSECLPNVKCPTFIFHGEHDPMIHRSHASYLKTHIAGSRLHIYPEGKHNIHIRYAKDFNKRVQEFLLQ